MILTTSQDLWQELNISSRNIKNENWSKYSLQSQRVGVSLCFWPLPKISGRNWTFRAEIAKTRIDRNIRCNLKGSGFPYVFDHFPRFLAGTEHFEQKYQKRELIGIFAAISNGRGFLMFLTTSQDLWQKLNISSRNLKNENWSPCHNHENIWFYMKIWWYP